MATSGTDVTVVANEAVPPDDNEGSDRSASPIAPSVVGKFGLIKAGLYFGNFVKITSHNKKAARYNMMLLSESGQYLRRKEGSVVHTALARSSFAVLDGEINDETYNLTEFLEQSGQVELIAIRKELINSGNQLCGHPPRVLQRSNRTAGPRSIGSVAQRSGKVGDQSDELDESRNNLYWVRSSMTAVDAAEDEHAVDNSVAQQQTCESDFVCLWYGYSQGVTKTSLVTVQRVALPLFECNSEVLEVERGRLVPLEEEAVERQCGLGRISRFAADYLIALTCFAEWSDSSRDSFFWPQFIETLFGSRDETERFRTQVEGHVLNRSRCGANQHAVILFLLCATHIGIIDQFVEAEYLEERCSDDILQLLSELSLLADKKSCYRSCSRVGSEYQVLEHSNPRGRTEDRSRLEGLVFSGAAPEFDEHCPAVLDFLSQVQGLRERHLWEGQLVEVPVNCPDFALRLSNLEAASLAANQSATSKKELWERLVAGSRSRNEKLTCSGVIRSVRPLPSSDVTGQQHVTVVAFSQSALSDGGDVTTFQAPAALCRFFSVPDDLCLELFFSCHGDAKRALEAVTDLLIGHQLSATNRFRSQSGCDSECAEETTVVRGRFSSHCYLREFELKHLRTATVRYPANMYKAHKKFNKLVRRSAVATLGAPVPLDTTPPCPSIASVVSSASLTPSEAADSVDTSGGDSAMVQPAVAVLSVAAPVKPEWTFHGTTMKETMWFLTLLFGGGEEPPETDMSLSVHQPSVASSVVHRNQGGSSSSSSSSSSCNDVMVRPSATPTSSFSSSQQPVVSSSSGESKSRPPRTAGGPQKLFTIKPNKNDDAVSGRRDPTLPAKWPATLPMMRHNMFWLKTSNSPCLCVGVDTVGARSDNCLTVVTVCCATYHHAVSVQASRLEPLDEEIVKQCADERAAGFALAMMDFAEWELASQPSDSPLLRWYVFPSFVRQFLQHMPNFAAWRKQAERAGRELKSDRRKMYFNALLETYNSSREGDDDDRLSATTFPWDDLPLFSSPQQGTPPGSDEASSTVKMETVKMETTVPGPDGIVSNEPLLVELPATQQAVVPKRSHKRKVAEAVRTEGSTETAALVAQQGQSVKRSSSSGALEIQEDNTALQTVVSAHNSIFWLAKSSLPCLYYDTVERRCCDRVSVLPISCSSYHYPVDAPQSYLEPLTADRLKECADDRTHDFTLALIDFAKWDGRLDSERQLDAISSSANDRSGASSSVNSAALCSDAADWAVGQFYVWPAFVLEMLTHPKQWAAWRKKVERSAVGKRGLRRYYYFEALRDEYEERARSAVTTSDQL